MEKGTKNKGITLIALVITIIILLILAGITITQLTNNGLFEKTQLAKEKSEQAQEEEKATLEDYENKMGQYIEGTRNENVKKYSTKEQVIGTWIDGSIIYSKVIKLNYPFSIEKDNSTILPDGIIPENVYFLIDSKFYVMDETNKNYGVFFPGRMWFDGTNWRYKSIDNVPASELRQFYLYIEYTKLT